MPLVGNVYSRMNQVILQQSSETLISSVLQSPEQVNLLFEIVFASFKTQNVHPQQLQTFHPSITT